MIRRGIWIAVALILAAAIAAAVSQRAGSGRAPQTRALVPGVSPFAAWTPPAGIPTPPFGIVEAAPRTPDPWDAPIIGFYYVDPGQPGATDEDNDLGTPGRPRQTIPLPVPAGAVVELRGTYDYAHASPRTLVANGTREKPVFIRGASATTRPLIRRAWELNATYTVLENLEFGPLDAEETGALLILAPSSHVALRNSDLHGNGKGGGVAIGTWKPDVDSENIVLVGNQIHDNGDVKANFDQDVHGIQIGARSRSVWIVDNEMARNSGDGIQINAGNSQDDQKTTHHIYVGRNVAHHNKQTGFWTKQAVDVVFSQNLCYGQRPSNSSFGACMGMQYSPERVWFIFNHIHDAEFGIALASNTDRGFGESSFIIGNVIHNIHHTTEYNPATAWSQSAIMMAGGVNRVVMNNTIHDVDAGIVSPSVDGSIYMANNILSDVKDGGGCHIFVEMEGTARRSQVRSLLLGGPVRVRWGGDQVLDLAGFSSAASGCADCAGGVARFTAPEKEDFRLRSGPQLVKPERAAAEKIFDGYRTLYGADISGDISTLGSYDAFALEPGTLQRPKLEAATTSSGVAMRRIDTAARGIRADVAVARQRLVWRPSVRDTPRRFRTSASSPRRAPFDRRGLRR